MTTRRDATATPPSTWPRIAARTADGEFLVTDGSFPTASAARPGTAAALSERFDPASYRTKLADLMAAESYERAERTERGEKGGGTRRRVSRVART